MYRIIGLAAYQAVQSERPTRPPVSFAFASSASAAASKVHIP
ncbi:hypothetical protein BURKHO8Y_20116 [Burkholderia sp. 8Y]|nr:hypothetical protein BURKHO8Y_20116 [Burkholderia sp. 8Y]